MKADNGTREVLLVEDDERLAAAIAEYLSGSGLRVHVVVRGDDALREVERIRPDVVVLDVMLPAMDGIEVCRRLRASGESVPIVMLTARDEDIDRVLGLEMGADEYLLKPIRPRVLLAHVRALLRRQLESVAEMRDPVLRFGELAIDGSNRDVVYRGERVRLGSAEFDLLWYLASRAGSVVNREEILRRLRGLEEAHEDRSIDARIYRLRKRFHDIEQARHHIKTVRPNGYLFTAEAWT